MSPARYAFDLAAYKARLAADPDSLGYPADLANWPPEHRKKCLEDCAVFAEIVVAESDAFVGRDRFDEDELIDEQITEMENLYRDEITLGDEKKSTRKAKGILNGGGDGYEPPGATTALPPPPDRQGLLLSAWLNKPIPLRDFLLGGVLCTTSRWFIFGETGIGKTLVAMQMAGAIAAGASFLKWTGQRRGRVMYLDGEMPMGTFKERMQLVADRYGSDIEIYGYNRDALGDESMPPVNTDLGQAWLKREIEAIKPDVIIFDSVMCLLIGSMSEQETWMPVRPFVRWLTSKKVAQIWLDHANDIGKAFGDKTRQWEMEAVVKLSKVEDDDTAILLEFTKARLRTPETASQFLPIIIHLGDWACEVAGKGTPVKRNEVEAVADALMKAFDRLADGKAKTPGFDGNLVQKVPVNAIRDELKTRGFLEKNETGGLTDTGRSHFRRAKTALLGKGKILEGDDLIWRK